MSYGVVRKPQVMTRLSTVTSAVRSPAVAMCGSWFAKYTRTSTGVPAATGKLHVISDVFVVPLRSVWKIAFGVVEGTADVRLRTLEPQSSATVEPWWYADGAPSVSAAQSGPPSVAETSGPPALTR